MNAGPIMPPSAAIIGNNAFLNEDSSPTRISRFISNPTKKKKMTINPSLIQCSNVFDNETLPTPMNKFSSQSAK
jgi:hypothetical protein